MEPSLTRQRIEELVGSFQGQRILVLGDMMLDEFIWGRVRRISPEAPVPIVEVANETYLLGGAGNVAANIRALDGVAIPVGVLGKDRAAERALDLMRETGIEVSGVFADDRPTTLKTRIIAHGQQIVRTDRESRAPLTPAMNNVLAAAFRRSLPSVHAVIVSDYDKGVVNRELLAQVLPEARGAGIPIFLDPKVHHADYYRPITMITPNHREAELLTGMSIENEQHLEEAGRRLLQKFDCAYAVITRGEEGMSLFDQNRSYHLPTFAREVFDVSGAGDTVVATLAMASSGGASMEESAILANYAAGLVVGKVGTATVSRAELLADFDSRNAHSAG